MPEKNRAETGRGKDAREALWLGVKELVAQPAEAPQDGGREVDRWR